LPFTIPGALVLTAALLVAFLHLVAVGTGSVPAQQVLDARFVELGSPAPAAEVAPQPAPPPPARKVVPAARSKPEPVRRPTAPTPTAPPVTPETETGEASTTAQTPSAATATRGASLGGSMSARALYRPLPEVPESLRHRDVELLAVARFQVAADGSAQVELVEPTSEPALNQSLLAMLRTWRFFPALEDGRPVVSTIDIRIPISVK
jgi:protein TonB